MKNILCEFPSPGYASALNLLEAMAAADLSMIDVRILLEMCRPNVASTVRALAALLPTTKPNVTRAIDRLAALGFAERKPDKLDGRSVLLVPTAKGRKIARSLARTVEARSA